MFMLLQARDFIDQYYDDIKQINTPSHKDRWSEILRSIEKTGTYDLTTAEAVFGAKTAWRNAPRCIGRIQWSKLVVFDARQVKSAKEMFEALCTHIEHATNDGNIRSVLTLFPKRQERRGDFRVWSPQLIRYAGYMQSNGSVIGDPANAEFTRICQQLGWKGPGGRFDVLPLVLSADGQDPEMFEIPDNLVLEVPITHPEFDWFSKLGLKWYALPAVSNVLLDMGGLEFPACPFNGWYMGTEIGARDFCDVNRYNLLEPIAELMGLDTKISSSLWKDRVLLEVNRAVLHSFQSRNVTITDHHAASESFMTHVKNEQRLRGGCPADWVWIVPPISGSICPVFHLEMLNYTLKPSYEYQIEPWKTHIWKDQAKNPYRGKKIAFEAVARAVLFLARTHMQIVARRVPCAILFATETGRSERYANILMGIFEYTFNIRVFGMDSYDIRFLRQARLILVVTNTFGNGDPPRMGHGFSKSVTDMNFDVGKPGYAVFGLGSSAYPNFCAFGKLVNKTLGEQGAVPIHDMGEGDELGGQDEAFQTWAKSVYETACNHYNISDVRDEEAMGVLCRGYWDSDKYRLTSPEERQQEIPIWEGLSKLHGRAVLPCNMVEKKNLQALESTRETIFLKLDIHDHASALSYAPGDHVALFPANQKDIVDTVISRLQNAPSPDTLVKLQMRSQVDPERYVDDRTFPTFTLRTALSRYLDVTTPPTPHMLHHLASFATNQVEKERLDQLANDIEAYEDWLIDKDPNLAEVLQEFQSVCVPPELLVVELPTLKRRLYSISSSQEAHPGELHLTVAVLNYKTKNGAVHHGVCSTWLNGVGEGAVVPCFIHKDYTFHLPEDNLLPVLLVGPGTGIAPFRAFWQHREVHSKGLTGKAKGALGKMTLYFGCRQSNLDDIYHSERHQLSRHGILHQHVAFSREPGKKKMYVQDIMTKHGHSIYRQIVQEGGHFYICGDASMAADIRNTFEEILQQHGEKLTSEEAKNYLLKLRQENRFHEDIFGAQLQKFEMHKHARRQKLGSVRKNPKQMPASASEAKNTSHNNGI